MDDWLAADLNENYGRRYVWVLLFAGDVECVLSFFLNAFFVVLIRPWTSTPAKAAF